MRRPARLVLPAALAALALVGFSGLGAAVAGERASVRQGTGDFAFDSWHSDFRLGLTPQGRSTLTTTETLVARFPDFDQNHGILRAIPTHYDGHPTDVTITGVTDGHGTPLGYKTNQSNDGEFLDVTIAADHFVHGAHTYVIGYRQDNVTLFPRGGTDEEFYWEANGTGWDQPFGAVSATLHVAPRLAERLTGDTTCRQGAADSARRCDALAGTAEGAGWRVDVGATNLGPHQGLAMVVGFRSGTFVPRDDSFTANPFPGIGLAGALLGLIGAVIAVVARSTRWRDGQGRPTIIAEYLPPKGVNLLQAADVSGAARKAVAAQFLGLAVRGKLRVLEGAGTNHYLLELVNATGLDETERGVLTRLFPGLRPGTQRDLKARSASLSAGLQGELRANRKRMLLAGLRERKGGALRGGLIALALVSAAVGVAGSAIALGTEVGGAWPVLTLSGGIILSVLTLALTATVRPLTAAGAELRDYLKGVKLYIGLAEADRLRVLQSPEGALRSPYRPDPAAFAGPDGAVPPAPLQVLKLYERLLPFAVLYGQEKHWSGVLGDYYTRSGSQPDWYAGSGAFNAAYFAAGIGAFSSATSASWSGSASSSSSSGFGGGGSVGGGGGGGGGGGV